MKKTETRNRSKSRSPATANLEVDANAVHVLRTLRDNEAFYFYEAIGKPTGQTARNLQEFLDTIKTAKSDTLMFHHARGDFSNWIEKTLGDTKLAQKLRNIASSNSDNVRKTISKTVENRCRELKESAPEVLVDAGLTVLVPSQ